MSGKYAPFGGIEVVGTVSDILYKSQRIPAISEQNESTRSTVGHCHSLTAQIGHSSGIVNRHFRKCAPPQRGRQGQRLRRNDIPPFYSRELEAASHYVKFTRHLLYLSAP